MKATMVGNCEFLRLLWCCEWFMCELQCTVGREIVGIDLGNTLGLLNTTMLIAHSKHGSCVYVMY